MSDNMNEFGSDDVADLITEQIKQLRNNYRSNQMDMEFKGFMTKLDRLTHDQRVELYNALVTLMAAR